MLLFLHRFVNIVWETFFVRLYSVYRLAYHREIKIYTSLFHFVIKQNVLMLTLLLCSISTRRCVSLFGEKVSKFLANFLVTDWNLDVKFQSLSIHTYQYIVHNNAKRPLTEFNCSKVIGYWICWMITWSFLMCTEYLQNKRRIIFALKQRINIVIPTT